MSGGGDGGGGSRTPWETASSIVARDVPVPGSHVLRIAGYSRTKGIGNGRCLVVPKEIFTEPVALYVVAPPSDMHRHFGRLLSGGEGADITFKVGGETFAAHRCVLAARSSVFMAELMGPMKEKTATRVRIDDMEARVFKAMLHFIYTDSQQEIMEDETDAAAMAQHLLVAARTERPAATPSFAAVPTSDVHRHLGQLLSVVEGTDVVFEVAGERFGAHRCILAARSSVFMAELFGPIKKEKMDSTCVQIYDVEAKVFKAMLHFIYTDSQQEIMEDETDAAGMAQHLLVVADRYNLERLTLICEDDLRRRIDASTAATTLALALAEQHGCHGLKDACLEFLASPGNLKAVMGSDGFGHLSKSCPDILKELAAKIH